MAKTRPLLSLLLLLSFSSLSYGFYPLGPPASVMGGGGYSAGNAGYGVLVGIDSGPMKKELISAVQAI